MTARPQDAAGARATRLLELQQNMANRWVDYLGQATQQMMPGRFDPVGLTKSYVDLWRGLAEDAAQMADLLWGTGETGAEGVAGRRGGRRTGPTV